MKKPASKVAEPAQIQPKSQFLFHKNLPPRDFSLMTLTVGDAFYCQVSYILESHNLLKKSKYLCLFCFLYTVNPQAVDRSTEMRFGSFFSHGFIADLVVNPPEKRPYGK